MSDLKQTSELIIDYLKQKETEPATPSASARYPVNDVYLSVQGEGAKTGMPMLIVRLQGCAVGCYFCDTKETWELDPANDVTGGVAFHGKTPHFRYFEGAELAAYCRQFVDTNSHWNADRDQWILLTGGEPANYMLGELVRALHDRGFKVALETSGTAWGHLAAGCDWVTVSPKINNPAGMPLDMFVLEQADELKFVIGGVGHSQEMFALLDKMNIRHKQIISLQPISQSKPATRICFELAIKLGYSLSLQTHKYIDIP